MQLGQSTEVHEKLTGCLHTVHLKLSFSAAAHSISSSVQKLVSFV